ncbi:MAG: hypothetical protein AAFR04_11235 [Pseudomonadota bacterium]
MMQRGTRGAAQVRSATRGRPSSATAFSGSGAADEVALEAFMSVWTSALHMWMDFWLSGMMAATGNVGAASSRQRQQGAGIAPGERPRSPTRSPSMASSRANAFASARHASAGASSWYARPYRHPLDSWFQLWGIDLPAIPATTPTGANPMHPQPWMSMMMAWAPPADGSSRLNEAAIGRLPLDSAGAPWMAMWMAAALQPPPTVRAAAVPSRRASLPGGDFADAFDPFSFARMWEGASTPPTRDRRPSRRATGGRGPGNQRSWYRPG